MNGLERDNNKGTKAKDTEVLPLIIKVGDVISLLFSNDINLSELIYI